MDWNGFIRIEREGPEGSKHVVVHATDPKFTLELAPDGEASDGRGRGVIKRVCVPNSWAGDYGRYAKLLTQAQEFFARSFDEPVAKDDGKSAAPRPPVRG